PGRRRRGVSCTTPGPAATVYPVKTHRPRLRDLLTGERPLGLAVGTRSELWRKALSLIPGGVNSPVRAMRAVGVEEPLFVRRGKGAYVEDVNGNHYVDWVMSWGPLLFGHAD